MSQDIHGGFADADHTPTPEPLYDFLKIVDAMPVLQQYRRQMRPLLALQPGQTLLDVGCGLGLETSRLAQAYPDVAVIGLDRETMLAAAKQHAAQVGATVRWLPGQAEAIPLPATSVDACLTDRVLKYLPDPAVAIAEMVRVLKPGGRIVSFELDYAATLLGGDPTVAAMVGNLLNESVGEARMGRRLPTLLHQAGLIDLTFQPFSFCSPAAIYEATVDDPVRAAIHQGRLPEAPATAWLDDQSAASAAGRFTIAFVGFLVSGHLPPSPATA